MWSDGSQLPQFLVLQAGTYAVTATNACFMEMDTVEVTVSNLPPAVILPPDMVLCPNESIVLSNAGPEGAHIWQDQSTADTFIVHAPGQYSLAVTNACGTGHDTIHVSYKLPLALDLGPDFSLCSGESFVLDPGESEVSYQWQDMSVADTFIVTGPGVYHVTISDECTMAADTVAVTLNNNPPDVVLPASINLCEGAVITLEANIGGVSYSWENGSPEPAIEVNPPGTYSLTVSSNCGMDVDSVVVIDAGPAPQVSLGDDVSICPGETAIISPTFMNVNSWIWNDGTAADEMTVNGTPVLSIEAMNVCGMVADTVQVTLLAAIPDLFIGNDTALCPGESVSLAIPYLDVNILWSDGTQGNSITVDDAGSYHAMITNSCGQAADTMDISILPAAPAVDLGVDVLWCLGDVFVFDPVVNNADHMWQDGSTATSFTATTPGIVILQVSNSCGLDIDTVLIGLNPNGPQVDLGPDIAGCVGEEITINAGVSDVDYTWQDGSIQSSFTTSTSSTLILTISNHCGVDTDTVEVDLSGVGPKVQLSADTVICDGTILTLTPIIENGGDIEWQDGSIGTDFAVTTDGTYSLVVTNECGIASDSIDVGLTFAPAPFSLGPDTTLCLGESIVLSAPDTGDEILWYDGSTDQTIIADEGHVYTVQVSNQCGMQTDAIELTVIDEVPVITLVDHINRCPEEILTLDVTQPFPVNYAWSTGEDVPAITILTPGVYAITIFNECFTVQDEVIVTEDDCAAHVFIPNVFSPNGDGINDVFAVRFSENIEVLTISGTIYDRWGDLVYASAEIPFAWNAHFAARAVNPGVFVYRILVTYRLRGMVREEHLVGDVTVVR